ncbi:MAG: ribosomal protein S18-alanine N-acetyltransferase [Actinomycetales bacterium]|nr:ribosomal protein S18-alanine N-acetyltransferase [Actinomycetales bacterium]
MISYREATLLDIPILVSMDRAYFPHTAWPAEQFRAEIGKATRMFLVVESNAQIIAYAGAFLPNAGGEGDIMTIAVAPEFRRKGIAKELIARLESWAKARGAIAMMLEVDVSNIEAIKLYQNLGYESLNIRKNYYGYGRDAQIMRRGL